MKLSPKDVIYLKDKISSDTDICIRKYQFNLIRNYILQGKEIEFYNTVINDWQTIDTVALETYSTNTKFRVKTEVKENGMEVEWCRNRIKNLEEETATLSEHITRLLFDQAGQLKMVEDLKSEVKFLYLTKNELHEKLAESDDIIVKLKDANNVFQATIHDL